MNTAVYGVGVEINPIIGSCEGNMPLHGIILKFCIIPTKVIKINDFANESPGHRLRPAIKDKMQLSKTVTIYLQYTRLSLRIHLDNQRIERLFGTNFNFVFDRAPGTKRVFQIQIQILIQNGLKRQICEIYFFFSIPLKQQLFSCSFSLCRESLEKSLKY